MTKSTILYEPGEGGSYGVSQMSTAVHRSPNKLWRSKGLIICIVLLWLDLYTVEDLDFGSSEDWLSWEDDLQAGTGTKQKGTTLKL